MTSGPGPYRPRLREVLAWAMLGVVGFLLDGALGLVPMVLVIAVAGARLDWSVLGRIGLFLVALAGVGVLLDSTGSIADVHAEFVNRSLTPHHLVFIGLALLVVQVLGDVEPASLPTVDQGHEPLAHRPPVIRIGLVLIGGLTCLLAALGVLLT